MGLQNIFCRNVTDVIMGALPDIRCVYSYETEIKDVPLDRVIAAFGIKKSVLSEEIYEEDENGIKIPTNERKLLTTLSVNFYTPSSMGLSAGIDAYDEIMSAISLRFWNDLKEARLLGTSYSRETQSLVTKAEFDFSFIASGPVSFDS